MAWGTLLCAPDTLTLALQMLPDASAQAGCHVAQKSRNLIKAVEDEAKQMKIQALGLGAQLVDVDPSACRDAFPGDWLQVRLRMRQLVALFLLSKLEVFYVLSRADQDKMAPVM
jgi:hypothetical protein